MRCFAAIDRSDTAFDGMLRIPGGTFRMGSDKHYPEEAPVHRVTVDEFFIDRTPVTNRQFKEFVRAMGHVTFAEIPPRPEGLSRRAASYALCRFAGVFTAVAVSPWLPSSFFRGRAPGPVGTGFWPVVLLTRGWSHGALQVWLCQPSKKDDPRRKPVPTTWRRRL